MKKDEQKDTGFGFCYSTRQIRNLKKWVRNQLLKNNQAELLNQIELLKPEHNPLTTPHKPQAMPTNPQWHHNGLQNAEDKVLKAGRRGAGHLKPTVACGFSAATLEAEEWGSLCWANMVSLELTLAKPSLMDGQEKYISQVINNKPSLTRIPISFK